MKLEEKTIKKNYIYNGRIINLRRDDAELPDGRPCVREVVEHNGGVCVAALTDDEELIFVRQFRYPYMDILLELPAGKLEKGEDAFPAGKRELLEETGYEAAEYDFLGKFYPSCGYTDEIIYLYLAKNLTFKGQHLDDDEFVDLEKIPLKKAVQMVLNNEIPDGKTQAAILKTYLKVKGGIEE
ncbi:MAG: NUDIX hydrolase [Clostridia bacterium]|nr:NUDIX hydrolase [Clostridia bacterium]